MNWITWLSSFLLSLSLSKIVADFSVNKLGLNLFSSSKYLYQELKLEKTHDFVFFLALLIFGCVFYLILKRIRERYLKKKDFWQKWFDLTYFVFAFILFLQIFFVVYSTKMVGLILILFNLILGLILWLKEKGKLKIVSSKMTFVGWMNALFLGFYLTLGINQVSSSVLLSLVCFSMMPLAYWLMGKLGGKKWIESPTHLLLLVSILKPESLFFWVFVGVLSGFLTYISRKRETKKKLFAEVIYPGVIILLLSYNPLFYTGNLDVIEEGFWLGWLQRLLNDQVIYKDFLAYHPPLLLWGLFGFTKFFGISILKSRLYFHLLQLVGILIFAWLTKLVLKNKWHQWGIILTTVYLWTNSQVRNNVEIRLGVGLLAIIFYLLSNKKDRKWLFLSGLMAALSLMVSLEVGLVVLVALLTTMLIKKIDWKKLRMFGSGLMTGLLPFTIYLKTQGNLKLMIEQLRYYSGIFTQGYLNIGIPKTPESAYFYWHLFIEYLESEAFFWHITMAGIVIAGVFVVNKFLEKKIKEDNYSPIILLTLFTGALFRSCLARSDWHHLLMVLPLSLMLILYVIEQSKTKSKYLGVGLLLFVSFLPAKRQLHNFFIQNQILKLEIYANTIGERRDYQLERSQIRVDDWVNVKELTKTVNYIQENTEETDLIFTYPWLPEMYFLSDRNNSTRFDTPYAFMDEKYQKEMVNELMSSPPKYIIYNEGRILGGFKPSSLPLVNDYINADYETEIQIEGFKILKTKN